ncbi:hypothetical protein B0H19DRAFT_1251897 [Mycena capillaripes]|nr:hypothetical protein B0H19DRAFT_1251897 [Mycena capillaripes]
MAIIPEASVSVIASELPNNLSIKVLVAIFIFTVIVVILHYASLQRLTDVLVDAMIKLKKMYAEVLETGHLTGSEIEKLKTLKRKVSTIQAETVDNSRSYWKPIYEFFKFRTLTVLLCIREVRDLEKHIKIQMLTPEPSAGAVDGVVDNVQKIVNGGTLSWRGRRQVEDA